MVIASSNELSLTDGTIRFFKSIGGNAKRSVLLL
jgi:hypothetical protein